MMYDYKLQLVIRTPQACLWEQSECVIRFADHERSTRYNEHTRKTSDAEGGICFSCAIRERAACVAGGKARQRGLVI